MQTHHVPVEYGSWPNSLGVENNNIHISSRSRSVLASWVASLPASMLTHFAADSQQVYARFLIVYPHIPAPSRLSGKSRHPG